MSADLGSLLRAAAATQERNATLHAPEPRAEARMLAARATRRRALRVGAVAVGATAVVAATVLAIQGLTMPEPVPPAPPAPVEPSPAMDVDGVTSHPALPAALPLQPGLLEEAGPGWTLVLYGAPALPRDGMPPTVLYLVSPDGEAFEVPNDGLVLDGDDRPVLVEWEPGTSSVLARVGPDHQPEYALLDVRTGAEILRLGGESPAVELVGDGTGDLFVTQVGSDGAVSLARVDTQGHAVAGPTSAGRHPSASATAVQLVHNPTRTAVIVSGAADLAVLDARDLSPIGQLDSPFPDTPDACTAWGWVDAGVILSCSPDGQASAARGESSAGSALWLAPVDGAPAEPFGPPGELTDQNVRSAWTVDGRTVVRLRDESGDDGSLRMAEVDGEALTELPRPAAGWMRLTAVAGDRLIAVTLSGDDDTEFGLMSVDPFTGSTTALIGRPEQPVPGVGLSVLGVVGGITSAEAWQ